MKNDDLGQEAPVDVTQRTLIVQSLSLNSDQSTFLCLLGRQGADQGVDPTVGPISSGLDAGTYEVGRTAAPELPGAQ